MSRPIQTAAPSDAAAPTNMIAGSPLTAKLERNSASRVARPMTWAAMAPADVRTAVATNAAWEGALDVTRPADLEASPIPFRRRVVDAARNASSRFLSLFAEVKAGERATALLLTANVFLLLSAYYLLKIVREPLILAGGGAEVKSYAAAGQALLLAPVVRLYGALASRFGRIKLVSAVTIFFVLCLVAFFALGQAGVSLGVPFYLWVGIFNVTMIAQFWSFANDVYNAAEGKRLFPLLGAGSSVGAIAGARLAKALFHSIGPYPLMLVAAAILLVCLALTALVHRWDKDRKALEPARRTEAEAPIGKSGGFALLVRDRYLALVAVLTLLLNWVNSTGEYLLDRSVVELASRASSAGGASAQQIIGEFKADYFAWINVAGVVLQLFVVSRVFKHIGVKGALFVLPLVALAGYGSSSFVPILSVLFVAKVAENSVDYSLQNTTRQALFLVTSREAKYKAKAAIDTFVMRLGDVLAAAVVWMGTRARWETHRFIVVNIALVACWLFIVVVLGKEHDRRAEEA
jgi:AAA family ATP:ADP antiporter